MSKQANEIRKQIADLDQQLKVLEGPTLEIERLQEQLDEFEDDIRQAKNEIAEYKGIIRNNEYDIKVWTKEVNALIGEIKKRKAKKPKARK
jgi:chromosome segregation ATPase